LQNKEEFLLTKFLTVNRKQNGTDKSKTSQK
jgi:hypothetical protein